MHLPETYEPLLARVERPGRYTGGEIHATVKDPARLDATIALVFPDVYDLGMSYHGFRILYELVNARPNYAAERVFAPWPDFADALRAEKLPLTTLETYRPLSALEIIGFTLQHELGNTNVLEMLDLGGIPLRTADRTALFPLVIAGGEGAWSPEPLAPFIDAFVLGDGEDILFEILDTVRDAKSEPSLARPDFLRRLARIPGLYVPSLYNVSYQEDGAVAAIAPLPGAPAFIEPRAHDIAQTPGPLKPVVPLIRTAQDRSVLEIRRGCVHGCRFCHAGMTNRPVRERPVEQILDNARELLANTGDDSLTLLSLSTADYTQILPLVRRFNAEFAPQGRSISLPSLRISSFDIELAAELSTVRKSGFTFAPEAGSDRLRRVINKPLDEPEFLAIIARALQKGWRTLKMYFMLGLPGETNDDLDGIVRIIRGAMDAARARGIRNLTINLTLSLFVPKAHTPFQWEAQIPLDEMRRRTHYIRDRLPRNVEVKMSSHETSVLEAVFARGDRRLADVLETAWRKGARFDAWRENWRPDAWAEAFANAGLSPDWYAQRARPDGETFPFAHIGAPGHHEFLARERDKARQELTTPECTGNPCAACAACAPGGKNHSLANAEGEAAATPSALTSPITPASPIAPIPPIPPIAAPAPSAAPPAPVQRLRLRYSKTGPLRYTSHLDLAEAIHRILRRSGADIAHTLGFNPQPRVSLSPPLSLGFEGQGELADIYFNSRAEPLAILKQLRAIAAPAGFEWTGIEEVPLKAPSLQEALNRYNYIVALKPRAGAESAPPAESSADPAVLAPRIARFLAETTHEIELERKGKKQKRDARAFVLACELIPPPEGFTAAVRFTLLSDQGTTLSPLLVLETIAGTDPAQNSHVRVCRLPLDIT